MSKAIVLYNSRTGNTKQIAMKIAEGLGIECFDNKHIPDLENYELIVVGSWMMAGKISFAGTRMLRKITRKSKNEKKVALFFTSGTPDVIHPTTANTTNPRKTKDLMFEQMENIFHKNKKLTILPERCYSAGASRIFKNGKIIDGFGHPTEEELAQAQAFGKSLMKY
ncbi:MAG TPA: flavodoxin family protein [Candidatus Bathyarchaeia archaeon]|nr:flavodoxin family protein [Candidatus Bathyarchaeia archaeon]